MSAEAEEWYIWKQQGMRGTGPSCPCCHQRNMQRMGYSLYRCQETKRVYVLIVDAEEGIRLAHVPKPLECVA